MIWNTLKSTVMDNNFITPQVGGADSRCCPHKIQAIKVAIFLLRVISLLSFIVFIVWLPLGDPKESCTKLCNKENVGQALAYNYVCNVYKALATTVKVTSNTMQEASEFTSCFLVNALYDAKIKFYTLLSLVDKQDLCTVCCQEDDDLELSSSSSISVSKEFKKHCKCKTKCCKRQQQKPRNSLQSLY